MTNFEFYKDKILPIINGGDSFGIVNGTIINCYSNRCQNCDFRKDGFCNITKMKWLYEEHKEIPKLTVNENMLCKILNFNYMARDEKGTLAVYTDKPTKYGEVWSGIKKPYLDFKFCFFKDCDFSFIKWEDDEPWAIEELLKLEVTE